MRIDARDTMLRAPRRPSEERSLTSQSAEPTPAPRRMPESDDFPSGPAIGERLPDFTLPDQSGKAVNFTAARDGRRALVMFHRSSRW